MNTTYIPNEIIEFARRVRQELSDLRDVDELTEGLEADLAEAYAEDLERTLPDPVEYATELRYAAGLPERGKKKRINIDIEPLKQQWNEFINQATIRPIADFLRTMQPVWWLMRAYVAWWLLMAFIGLDFSTYFVITLPLLIAFVIVSVQWGRGLWRPKKSWFSGVIVAGNILAAVMVLPAAAYSAADIQTAQYPVIEYLNSDKMINPHSGELVTNIFAFDSEGNPIIDFQLFDQAGRPLEANFDLVRCGPYHEECTGGDESIPSPRVNIKGQILKNVFPYSLVAAYTNEDGTEGEPVAGAEPVESNIPFEKVPALK